MNIRETFEKIKTRQILTSRGEPTVEVEIHTIHGAFRSSCPSGASTGSKEAKVILDKNEEYQGKSVRKAIFNIKNLIIPRIEKKEDINIYDQFKIDEYLNHVDGTDNKHRLGANSILPVSMSFCRAGAGALERPLREFIAKLARCNPKMPIPYFNVINGGMHSGNNLAFQEIMIAFHNKDFAKNLECAVVFYNHLKNAIIQKYGKQATGTGDEGGFAPPIENLEEGLALIMEAYEASKLRNMKIAIDCAASEFFDNGKYNLKFKKDENDELKTSEELIQFYEKILEKYPLIHMLEDPFDENDFLGWEEFYKLVGEKINIVGDDLTVTNPKFIKNAIEKRLCNSLLVKLNQIGTVSESIKAIEMARKANMKIMVSHRSGETEDTFISDFAVGIGADYIKAGAPCRGERVAKYNQLLRIFENMK